MNGYCKLFIYKDCKILKNKNFKVDDIQTYLSTLSKLNNAPSGSDDGAILGQYMKHQLKMKYIIDFAQTNKSTFGTRGQVQEAISYDDYWNYNYLEATNVDRYIGGSTVLTHNVPLGKVYYFITGKRWVSEKSIELELEMDVINTLIDNVIAQGTQPLSLSDKSFIIRQHKDRFAEIQDEAKLEKKIDLYSENIHPVLFKTGEIDLGDQIISSPSMVLDRESWYLIFRSRTTDDNSPLDVLLLADNAKTISGRTQGYYGTRDPKAELKTYYYWVIYGDDGNIGTKVSFVSSSGNITIEITNANQAIFITRHEIVSGSIDNNGWVSHTTYHPKGLFSNFRSVTFQNAQFVRKADLRNSDVMYVVSTDIASYPQDTSFPTTTTDQVIGDITDVDRTDPKLLKILKLPYCPAQMNFSDDGNKMDLDAGWGVKASDGTFPQSIYLADTNRTEAFHRELTLRAGTTPFAQFLPILIENFGINKKRLRGTIKDPKLLHSDFYQPKFVYDSFSYIFKGELYDAEYLSWMVQTSDMAFKVDFYVSATMNSKMMFMFPTDHFEFGEDYPLKLDLQDYSGLLYVARNNELPIYNSAFLNYMRTAYNYDIKTKNRQLANNIVSGALSFAGAYASAVAGGPVGWAGAVALGVGATKSFYSAISQTAQAEQNIAEKLKSTEMQGLSVIGSDDVDLMSEYTRGNKAKLLFYEASSKMKQNLENLFYYTGYIANIQGIPDTTSRMWFNFVQAEVIFNYEQNFSQELVEELKKKYLEGITFLHKVITTESGSSVNNWDFEQQYENWELSCTHPISIHSDPNPSTIEGGREYVIKNAIFATDIGRLTNNGKLTWRKRSKSTLQVLASETGLDTITIKGNAIPKAMDVRIGSTIHQEVTLLDYVGADYYWTIEFSETTTGGYNQNIVKASILGYIEIE